MALFGRKKGDSEDDAEAQELAFTPSPEKARKWFEHARTMADSFNYDSALVYYANGVKLDPSRMLTHEEMMKVALRYRQDGGKPASGKEVRSIGESNAVSKFAAAEFAWMKDIENGSLAVKAMDAAIKADILEFGHWVAPHALNLSRRAKRVSRGSLMQIKQLASSVGAWDVAIAAGTAALQLDPTDSELDRELKEMAAERAMDQGGYEENVGKEGGFRKFVKDMDKQQALSDADQISGNQSTEERILAQARAEYESNPKKPDVINRLAQLVKKEGGQEAEAEAIQIYMTGYEVTGEFRFKMHGDDIKLAQMRAKLNEMPDDEAKETAKAELADTELEHFQERTAKYPTDRTLKFRLGEVALRAGNIELATECFQRTKDEPKFQVRAGHLLGRCFAAEAWHAEAIAEYKEAIASLDSLQSELELPIRYDLMVSMIDLASSEQSEEQAREALEICSSIARKDITYRDIRSRRKEIDQLLKQLRKSNE